MQTRSRLLQSVIWVTIASFSTTNVLAGTVDLATAPLVTGLGKTVAPNIFFILDDSGSMASEFMPDSVDDDNNNSGGNDYSSEKRPCTLNFGYNTIYYNPNTTYNPPVDSTGASYAAATFTGAWTNGFNTGAGTTNLSASTPIYTTVSQTLANNPVTTVNGSKIVTFKHGALSDGHVLATGDQVTISGVAGSGNPQRISNILVSTINTNTYVSLTVVDSTHFSITAGSNANATNSSGTGGSGISVVYKYQSGSDANYYYYNYTSSVAAPPSTCQSNGSYTRVPASGQTWASAGMTAAQQTNFANWYSYYRTRLLMMKTASGRAFSTLTDKYRVGYTQISETGINAAKFVDVSKFDATQKITWFGKLYGATTTGSTPLRGALSKAGRYYAGKFADASTGAHDPIQYSCQKNFAIMTTDGYWNTGNESASYGPKKEDNSTNVGDQDSASGILPPYQDALAKSNTLADIAYYYYNTDLRPTSPTYGGVTDDGTRVDVSSDNVPTTNSDPSAKQHMTTFTLGLGVSGVRSYPSDYAAIVAGTLNWPDPQTSYTGNNDVLARVDDLWHAGINGHGQYLSAKDPNAVATALGTALQAITAVVGSSSAAATSNLQPVSGDNTAFIAQFKTVAWTGDVVARTIDVVTGVIPNTNDWSAQTLLDAQATRSIYTFSTTSGTNGYRRDFSYTNLNSTGEVGLNYFKSDATNPGGKLSQWDSLNIITQQPLATSSAMIDYIRGVRTNEDSGTLLSTDLFRKREHVLGDIVSAAPVFVRKPPFAYTDTNYATFLAAQASRVPTVYVGANDGMLHALDGSVGQSGSGKERWAYIPRAVIPSLYKLASEDYSVNHKFYVDGPITVGDAYSSSYTSATGWATILVGGLGGGGKGYYALDVTDPTSPKVLWEFGTTVDYTGDLSYDADVGYSYGNPVITKRHSDGRWVVIFASGYNNTTGDKRGRLYVVDAFTGAKLSEILTGTTANEDLSGIARISNYVEDGLKNNVTQYVYGGDLNGSLWRFDIDAGSVQKLADTSATAGARPITVQPELAKISAGGDTYTAVYFGTGRYLGPNDLSTSAPSSSVAQGIFAVKDTNTDLGDLTASGANLVAQTLDTSTSPRTSTDNAVDWSLKNGWYVTTSVGERFTVDPGLQLGTLVVAANIPETDYCNPTGKAILYQLSYKSGHVYTTSAFQAQIVGNTQLQLGGSGSSSVSGGKIVIVSVLADGTTMTTDQLNGGGAAGTAVRINWREIE